MTQHTHKTSPFSITTYPLVLLCDGVQSPANIGAIFRLADAFGVQRIVFSHKPDLSSNRLKRTARTTEQNIPFTVSEDLVDEIKKLTKQKYHTIALEISGKSIPLHTLSISKEQSIALLIGSESAGVSEEILQEAAVISHIEMHGKNSSMNVAQATAIALYEITKQL